MLFGLLGHNNYELFFQVSDNMNVANKEERGGYITMVRRELTNEYQQLTSFSVTRR